MATCERINVLKEYTGTNPKPDDFDLYWDKALVEMKNVNSNLEIKPANFQTSFAECYDMYFTGVNGAKIYVKHLIILKIQILLIRQHYQLMINIV